MEVQAQFCKGVTEAFGISKRKCLTKTRTSALKEKKNKVKKTKDFFITGMVKIFYSTRKKMFDEKKIIKIDKNYRKK
jgi:hypothetical protein